MELVRTDIQEGAEVRVRAADGKWYVRRAASGLVAGSLFPVVWVCTEQEWRSGARRKAAVPWPARYVSPKKQP